MYSQLTEENDVIGCNIFHCWFAVFGHPIAAAFRTLAPAHSSMSAGSKEDAQEFGL